MAEIPEGLQTDFSRDSLAQNHMRALYDYWCETGSASALPPVGAIDPTRLPVACLPYIVILEVEPVPLRFRARLTGTRVVEELGMDLTGCYMDELPGMAKQLARFRWCVHERRAYLAEDQITFAPNDYKRYRILGLPFGDAERGVQRILFIFLFLAPTKPVTI